ncbi:MAG TPA: hypothetical protein PKD26_13250 [Pyrinomonadaceae bacterium]|nr:hypothetical protein [Pyrinomonadaceae bacterium]
MATARCTGKNSKGERCKAYAGSSGYCFMHDAARGRERALARRNGGLATKKPHYADASMIPADVRTMDGVFAVLNYALLETLVLDNSIARGRLFVSIAHGFIEALKVGELEKRLEALEMALKAKQ